MESKTFHSQIHLQYIIHYHAPMLNDFQEVSVFVVEHSRERSGLIHLCVVPTFSQLVWSTFTSLSDPHFPQRSDLGILYPAGFVLAAPKKQ